MKSLFVLVPLLAILIFAPLTSSYSQVTDNLSGISVTATQDSQYVYKNEEGKTVVVGEIENRNTLASMSQVVIRAIFYDKSGEQVIEIVRNGAVLDVLPPQSTTPFVITSKSANPNIELVSVDVEAFNSSPTKSIGLKLGDIDALHTSTDGNNTFSFSGTIHNTGNAPSSDAIVHLAFYDVFSPARILHIESIPVGDLGINATTNFNSTKSVNTKAVGFKIFAESNLFQSDITDVPISSSKILTKQITISNLSIIDSNGDSISTIPIGTTVNISSTLNFQTVDNDRLQPYVYYVQIHQSGVPPFVEFLTSTSGSFYGVFSQSPSVQWTPQKTGLYYIETFVWDHDAIPIADKGPIALILIK